MASPKTIKPIKKEEGIIDKDVEEGKALRDLDRLERKDWQLSLLTVLLILILTLIPVILFSGELRLSAREFLQDLAQFKAPAYIFSSAFLIIGICLYLVLKKYQIRRRRKEIFLHKIRLERTVGSMAEVTAFFQISSIINAHKDRNMTLELIVREALNMIRGHRCTIFLLDPKSGILKTQFGYAQDPLNEQVGLFEEKEIARRTLRQRRAFLLREPRDFAEFFKYGERDRKITSMMSIPLSSQDRTIGVLSIALINEERRFTEKDLQFLMIFGNYASIAVENDYLQEEVRKGINFRKSYEQYLDDILNQLQSLSDVERRRIEDHIGRLLPAEPVEEQPDMEPQTKGDLEGINEALPFGKGMRRGRREDRVTKMLRVESEEESLGASPDLGEGGVFIRTPNPLDLGEQFLLKLHLPGEEEPTEVTCKVIWTNKYGKETRNLRRGMGVKFLNLTPNVQKKVEEYLRVHKNMEFSFDEEPADLEDQG